MMSRGRGDLDSGQFTSFDEGYTTVFSASFTSFAFECEILRDGGFGKLCDRHNR